MNKGQTTSGFTAYEVAHQSKDRQYLYRIDPDADVNKKLKNKVYIFSHYDSETEKCILYRIGYSHDTSHQLASLNGKQKLLYDIVDPSILLERIYYFIDQKHFNE